MEEMDTLRIVLLGGTGSGKSSLGNTIFGGGKYFTVHCDTGSNSKELWHSFTRQVHGRNIQLIDTSDICDTDYSTDLHFKKELLKCMTECAPGPHSFLLVLKVERFTRQEEAVVDVALKYFSEEMLKYTSVVFTHGDWLPEGMRIEEWVHENEALMTLVQKCGGRCHVFDNRYWDNSQDPYRNNKYQVRKLLKTIDQTVRLNCETGRGYYSNDFLLQVNNPQPKSFFSWLFGF